MTTASELRGKIELASSLSCVPSAELAAWQELSETSHVRLGRIGQAAVRRKYAIVARLYWQRSPSRSHPICLGRDVHESADEESGSGQLSSLEGLSVSSNAKSSS